jgi:glycosyltransferase involved in cell wall biosynthesis
MLWASVYCMLDTSSGASCAVRQMLLRLSRRDWRVDVVGATVFDHPTGTSRLREHWGRVQADRGKALTINDGPIRHQVLVTGDTRREAMTNLEEGSWFALYQQVLTDERPDVVFYFGGQPFDYLIADEAKVRGIPVAFYLANGNYHDARWHHDVDLLLTDSQATAALYRERLRRDVTPIGAFVDPADVVAAQRDPRHILFVNPVPSKGARWVVCLALWLETHAPELTLEVVESRGDWQRVLQTTTAALGTPRDSLPNVVVTPHGPDMRPVYGRAWLLVAPSLAWESAGRVIPEAMLNGVPVICSERGGMPEMVGTGGIVVRFDGRHYEQPWGRVPGEEEVAQLGELVVSLRRDTQRYEHLVGEARKTCESAHDIERNTDRLEAALEALLRTRTDPGAS